MEEKEAAEIGLMKRGGRNASIAVFALLLLLPLLSLVIPGGEGLSLNVQGKSLREKLSSIEESFEEIPLFERMRKSDQKWLVESLGVGNSRVVVGNREWLHYRADIEAVTGKGPFYEEPPSVARAPGLQPWNRPGPVILEFHKQLQERGIELWIVPIPTKSMMVSLEGESRTLMPEAYHELLAELEEAGLQVFDPTLLLSEPGSYLQRDTHWTPEAMARVAKGLAAVVRGEEGKDADFENLDLEMTGDLTKMLSDDEFSGWDPEKVVIARVVGDELENFGQSDPTSPWVLLGDSFVNVYDDPSLGFPQWSDERIGGGFAASFSRFAGQPMHTISVNGGGATGVRATFAALPDDVVRGKEKVLWVLSARDLMLSEIPGRRAGIRWDKVEFNREVSRDNESGSRWTVEATLRQKSQIGDPETTPYDSAVFSTIFDQVEGFASELSDSEISVFLWAFRNRELEATADLVEGRRYRMSLVPFPVEGPLAQTTQLDDFFRTDLPRYFAESIEEIE